MFKNLTPRQIAIFSATVTGILIMFFYFLLSVMGLDQYRWSELIILAALIIIAYLVNIFFLKRYIFRKIKLIYKTIHRLKLDPSQKQRNIDIGDHIFEDVEKDVALWAQDRQQEIDQLKTLENYRRDFLGNVSHELKTPIFNIQGYIHTLIDGGLQDPTINLKYLDRTAKNVDRLITIVDDLETISKLESGNLVLDIRKFDIRDLVKEVFESHEMTAQRRNIQLLFKEGAAQSYQVKADREYIRQVLDNLVLNSIWN